MALVDLDLPGMNGLELLDRLRARNPRIPAVIITAAGRERVREIVDRGIPHLRKPLDFRHLLALLSEQKLAH
jgi:CheY-like chemotaxis protein